LLLSEEALLVQAKNSLFNVGMKVHNLGVIDECMLIFFSVSMYASYSCASPMQVSNNPSSSRITVIVILGSEIALYGPWIVS